MAYFLTLVDDGKTVIATREFEVTGDHERTQACASLSAKALAMDAIHDAAIKGKLQRASASIEIEGAASSCIASL